MIHILLILILKKYFRVLGSKSGQYSFFPMLVLFYKKSGRVGAKSQQIWRVLSSGREYCKIPDTILKIDESPHTTFTV